MKNKNKRGQSLVEMIFSVGVVVIVITGIAILMVNTISTKNKGFDRKRATELADLVMEDLINQKKNFSDDFWKLIDRNDSPPPIGGFDGYTYSIGFTVSEDGSCLSTEVGVTNCANAVVNINWGNSQVDTFQRFFSRSSD